jgi:cytochrome P450
MKYEPKIFTSKNEYIHNTAAFIPFSSGPTNCAGKNLAYLEMRMAVAMIVQKFDATFEEGYNPETWYTDMLDYFVTMKGVLPTVLTPRKQKM